MNLPGDILLFWPKRLRDLLSWGKAWLIYSVQRKAGFSPGDSSWYHVAVRLDGGAVAEAVLMNGVSEGQAVPLDFKIRSRSIPGITGFERSLIDSTAREELNAAHQYDQSLLFRIFLAIHCPSWVPRLFIPAKRNKFICTTFVRHTIAKALGIDILRGIPLPDSHLPAAFSRTNFLVDS